MNSEITVVDETDAFEAALALRDPLTLFTNPDALSALLNAITEASALDEQDVSTAKGRKVIASMAAKVAKAKVRIDDVGKDYVADLKELPKKVDAGRKVARDYLDALKERVRAPLTAWEAEEQAKVDAANALAEKALREAEEAREREMAELRAKVAAQEEAERKRAEEAAQAERDRQFAAEATARAEKAAQERIEAAEREAKEAIAKAEREAQAKLDADRAERERVEAETKRRMDSIAHRGAVNREVVADLEKLGLDETTAKLVVVALAKGEIRHVGITY
jgi:colicin import membrane protein